jgi:hypothetical protein
MKEIFLLGVRMKTLVNRTAAACRLKLLSDGAIKDLRAVDMQNKSANTPGWGLSHLFLNRQPKACQIDFETAGSNPHER